jgi:hypothetical protein
MPATTFIYALCEPTGEIRYLGISKNPKERFRCHLKDPERNHRTNWISQLREQGQIPRLEILDEIPDSEWEFWEREYIRVFRAIGIHLTNGTAGGDKGPDCSGRKIALTAEQRRQRSETRIGEKNPFFARHHSDEQREKWKVSRKGRVFKKGHIQKNSSSGFVGVNWCSPAKKWRAWIPGVIAGTKKHLGYFSNKEDAIFARSLGAALR